MRWLTIVRVLALGILCVLAVFAGIGLANPTPGRCSTRDCANIAAQYSANCAQFTDTKCDYSTSQKKGIVYCDTSVPVTCTPKKSSRTEFLFRWL
jgi:hypothetical protein